MRGYEIYTQRMRIQEDQVPRGRTQEIVLKEWKNRGRIGFIFHDQ